MIISFIFCFISFLIINNVLLLEFKHLTLSINMPFIYTLLFLITLIFIIIILIYYFLKKMLKFNIQELLND